MGHYDEQLEKIDDENRARERESRIGYLESEIACACNALTDSVCVSGNDAKTNMSIVNKLRKIID